VHSSRLRDFLGLALLGSALGAVGCASARPLPKSNGEAAEPAGPYRLGPEDVIEIIVWNDTTLSRRVPIRPDGMISLPLVDDVKAANHTPMELRDLLTEKLKRFMPEPSVSVIVQEINSPKVSVVGEVVKPGRFVMKGPTTVLEAIALAEGFTVFASGSRVLLMRPKGGRIDVFQINRDELTEDGATQNVWLAPGDIVMVP
jgi:polysaccharide biosynthesis/export protein